ELKRLPLTANGKVDRNALPAPEEATEKHAYVAPRNMREEILVGIWEELLGRQQVSVEDSFFDIGGHSLLATQIISRIRETFEVELPLRALFDAPTVAGLAALIATTREDETTLAPPLVPIDRRGPLPLSFAQQRLWFLDQLDPGGSFYNIPSA